MCEVYLFEIEAAVVQALVEIGVIHLLPDLCHLPFICLPLLNFLREAAQDNFCCHCWILLQHVHHLSAPLTCEQTLIEVKKTFLVGPVCLEVVSATSKKHWLANKKQYQACIAR